MRADRRPVNSRMVGAMRRAAGGSAMTSRCAPLSNQLGAQLAQEVLYPNAQVDDKGEPFTGERNMSSFCEGPDSTGGNVLESGDVR